MAEKQKKAPIKLSTDLLADLGYEKLTREQATELLKELYKTLETLVGARLSNQMTDEQIDVFSQYIDAEDESGAYDWLNSNFPKHREEVRDVLAKLEDDLRQVSGKREGKSPPGPKAEEESDESD